MLTKMIQDLEMNSTFQIKYKNASNNITKMENSITKKIS